VAGQGAGVDALDAHDAMLAQVVVERHPGPPTRRERAGFLDDEAGQPGPARLDVLRVDAVVPDQRVGHAHHLAAIRGIGEDLLVAGHGGVEDHLAVGLAGRPKGFSPEDAAVGEREQGGARHELTFTPPTSVIHGAPRPVNPAKGVLRLRDWKTAGFTVQGRSKSRIVTSAAAPGARVPPGRPRSRAGAALSRVTSVGRSSTPGRTRRSSRSGTAVSSPTMTVAVSPEPPSLSAPRAPARRCRWRPPRTRPPSRPARAARDRWPRSRWCRPPAPPRRPRRRAWSGAAAPSCGC